MSVHLTILELTTVSKRQLNANLLLPLLHRRQARPTKDQTQKDLI